MALCFFPVYLKVWKCMIFSLQRETAGWYIKHGHGAFRGAWIYSIVSLECGGGRTSLHLHNLLDGGSQCKFSGPIRDCSLLIVAPHHF